MQRPRERETISNANGRLIPFRANNTISLQHKFLLLVHSFSHLVLFSMARCGVCVCVCATLTDRTAQQQQQRKKTSLTDDTSARHTLTTTIFLSILATPLSPPLSLTRFIFQRNPKQKQENRGKSELAIVHEIVEMKLKFYAKKDTLRIPSHHRHRRSECIYIFTLTNALLALFLSLCSHNINSI